MSSEVSGDGTVFDVDLRGVLGDHVWSSPAAGGLHGSGAGAAADEFGGQAVAAGVSGEVVDAGVAAEGREAAGDLGAGEGNEAICGVVVRFGGLEVADRVREGSDEEAVVFAGSVRVRLRGSDSDAERSGGAFGVVDVAPDNGGSLASAEAGAEEERDDGFVDGATLAGGVGIFGSAAAGPGLVGGREQLHGGGVLEGLGVSGSCVRVTGLLPCDAGDGVSDDHRVRCR